MATNQTSDAAFETPDGTNETWDEASETSNEANEASDGAFEMSDATNEVSDEANEASKGAFEMSVATNEMSDEAFDTSVMAKDVWKMTADMPETLKNTHFAPFQRRRCGIFVAARKLNVPKLRQERHRPSARTEYAAPDGAKILFWFWFYKYTAPTALKCEMKICVLRPPSP